MFEKLIRFSIEQRWLVLLAALGMAALGVFSYQKLPIDAVPDITNVQVQINTQAAGYSPLETEQRVTYPIETVMAGLPNLEQTRSLSRYGLSQVTVIFKDGTDIYFARQLVNERIQEARDNERLIDATYGRRTRSVVVMDSDHVVLSSVQPETITHRILVEDDPREIAKANKAETNKGKDEVE